MQNGASKNVSGCSNVDKVVNPSEQDIYTLDNRLIGDISTADLWGDIQNSSQEEDQIFDERPELHIFGTADVNLTDSRNG